MPCSQQHCATPHSNSPPPSSSPRRPRTPKSTCPSSPTKRRKSAKTSPGIAPYANPAPDGRGNDLVQRPRASSPSSSRYLTAPQTFWNETAVPRRHRLDFLAVPGQVIARRQPLLLLRRLRPPLLSRARPALRRPRRRPSPRRLRRHRLGQRNKPTSEPGAEYTLWSSPTTPSPSASAQPTPANKHVPAALIHSHLPLGRHPLAGTTSSRTSPTPSSSTPTATPHQVPPASPRHHASQSHTSNTNSHSAAATTGNDKTMNHDHAHRTKAPSSKKSGSSTSSPNPQASPRSSTSTSISSTRSPRPQAFDGLRLAGRKLRRPDRHIATVDHNVPTTSAARPPPHRRPDLPTPRSTPCARTAPTSASSSSTSRTLAKASST